MLWKDKSYLIDHTIDNLHPSMNHFNLCEFQRTVFLTEVLSVALLQRMSRLRRRKPSRRRLSLNMWSLSPHLCLSEPTTLLGLMMLFASSRIILPPLRRLLSHLHKFPSPSSRWSRSSMRHPLSPPFPSVRRSLQLPLHSAAPCLPKKRALPLRRRSSSSQCLITCCAPPRSKWNLLSS